MRAIRTPSSNGTLKLGGAGPEHDLPIRHGPSAGPDGLVAPGDPCYHLPYIATVWEPTHEERAHLAIGRNLELVLITGSTVPPLAIGVTDEGPADAEAAHAQPPLEAPAIWGAFPVPLIEDLIAVLTSLEARADEAEALPLEPELIARMARLHDLRAMLERNLAELQRLDAQAEEEEPE